MKTVFQYPKIVKDAWDKTPNVRFRIICGGRGKGATTSFAQKMIEKSFLHIDESGLCTRHIQKAHDLSTKRSLEKVIKRCVHQYIDRPRKNAKYRRQAFCRLEKGKKCPGWCTKKENLSPFFDIQKNIITNKITRFVIHFNGLSKVTEDEAKGAEDFKFIWLSEAHSVPLSSLQKFLPSVREEGSEVWIDYNPENRDDAPTVYFLKDPDQYPPECRDVRGGVMFVFMNYKENPFFSEILENNMKEDKEVYSKEDWLWIWTGKLRKAMDRYIYDAEAVKQAMAREIDYPLRGSTVIACDVAHQGGDEIVMGKRVGLQTTDVLMYRNKSVLETSTLLEELAFYDKSIPMVIDNGSMGAGVADILEDKGYIVYRVNFGGGEKSFNGWESTTHSKNMTTDMKRHLNHKLRMEGVVIPYDNELYSQMTERRVNFVKGDLGVYIVESKDDFAKHYTGKSKSPDRADMLEMLYYFGDDAEPWTEG